jgi:hypothetical protein
MHLPASGLRTIVLATVVAGTLDILSAFVFARPGVGPVRVLQSVATGPFGEGMVDAGLWGAAAGLITHFTIMAAMVCAFVLVTAARPGLLRSPLPLGAAYGLLLYGIMYWIVLPLRWPDYFPQTGLWEVSNALFSHIVCVGLPMALIVAWQSRSTAAATA